MVSHPAAARHGLTGLLLGLLLTSACGGSSSPPPPNPGPGTGGDTITGRERIGWSQSADSTSQLETFDYAIYVDGTRSVLTGESCGGSPSSFECSAPLPRMSSGQHSIELASFITVDDVVLESEKSSALRVTVTGSTAPADAVAPEDATLVTSDGHRFRASILARSLDDPTDLAIAPDGRIFVAERGGRVRIIDLSEQAEAAETVALEIESIAEQSGLTSIALHPEFARTRHVYLAYAVEGRDGPAFRIARFSESRGTLAQGAIVARERELADHATIRFGPDGRLFVGVAAGEDPRTAQSAASVLGKILRLNEDGTTPRDNPGSSPVFSSGHRDPRALTWHPSTRALWELDRDREAGDEVNIVVSGADYGWPQARGGTSASRSVGAALMLPAATDVSGASFVPLTSQSPIAGELVIASRGAEDLLRVRPGANNSTPGLVEGLLQGRYGRISAVQVSGDGTIYLTTANRDTWGAGRDLLIRLSADEQDRRSGIRD